jgi:hypothetical protein
MCEGAFAAARNTIKGTYPKVDPAYVDDYVKIWSVILDHGLIAQVLETLGKSISANAASSTPETSWLRFSGVLTYYEKKCGFWEDVLLPTGVLDPDDFHYYIRCGYVLKDFGAGVKHGEFTHRLQWHVIMSVATMGFTRAIAIQWEHSPFELYTSLGKERNQGIWGMLLDQRGDGTFSHPDSFHEWLLQEAPASIQSFLVRRENKRREQFIADICAYVSEQSHLGDSYNVPDIFFPGQYRDPKLSHQDFKEFEKWFATELYTRQVALYKPPQGVFKTQAEMERDILKATEDVFNSVADRPKHAYAKAKTDPKLLGKKTRRTKVYVPLARGPVYALSGVPVRNENEAEIRAKVSRIKFL